MFAPFSTLQTRKSQTLDLQDLLFMFILQKSLLMMLRIVPFLFTQCNNQTACK